MNCPCCSGKEYSDCCQKYHEGQDPENALALMRSRYSGYALHKIDYIIQTTHSKNPSYTKDFAKWRKEIQQFAQNTSFEKLEILQFEEENQFAYVTFRAFLKQGTIDASFTERSRFEKVDGKWLYLDGMIIS